MKLAPGDLVELRFVEGVARGRVDMVARPYPPAITFEPHEVDAPGPPVETITLLVSLDAAARSGRVQKIGWAPPAPPRFRVPVRDRSGQVLYEWVWDGVRLQLPETKIRSRWPLREIVPYDRVWARLPTELREAATQ